MDASLGGERGRGVEGGEVRTHGGLDETRESK